jgi:signal transduction histidine kinase
MSGIRSTDATGKPGVRHSRLRQADGERSLGDLWLDADPEHAGLATPVIELAVDTAWARAELQANTARLEALDDASRAIAGVLDVERVLQVIVDRVRDLVRAEYAALGTVDEQGQITRFITSGMSDEQRLRIGPIPRGRGLLGLIIRENRSYLIPEIGVHPDSSGFPPEHPAMHSFLGVPVVVKGRSVGNLYLTNKLDAAEFSPQDQRLVEMFALHAGIAFENAALHQQVQRLAIVDERERIGKDLHDGIIQSIYGVGLSLEDVPEMMAGEPDEAAARIDRAIDALNGTIRDIRNFIFGLRPELVEQGDLVAGLATLASEFQLNTVIEAELEASALEGGEPPTEIRAELLQIAREALSNVARHSRASSVRLRIGRQDGTLEMVIADNGRGFDASQAPPEGHLGIANMRARAADLGGVLTIDSLPGRGTDIIVRVSHDGRPSSSPAGRGT